MSANGNKTKWTGRECFTTPITASPMMANGKKISSKAGEHSTMRRLYSSIFPLISRTGKMSMSTGSNTRDSSWRIAKMAQVNYFCRMVKYLREISRTIQYGVKDS